VASIRLEKKINKSHLGCALTYRCCYISRACERNIAGSGPNVVDAILVDIWPIYEMRESAYARGWTGMHGRSHASHMTTDTILW